MQNLTVTLVQADQVWEDKAANLRHFEALLKPVSDTDLILLPEMFNTGFSMHAAQLAEPAHDSPSIQWLLEKAVEKKAAIYTSLMILEGGAYFNRGVFVEPNGRITTYDKRKTFGLAGEDKVFTAGTKEVTVAYRGWKIRLQICYDLRFPEISLNRIPEDSPVFDLLLYVANWPEKRKHHWNSLLVARAIENQCFVAAVNRVGDDASGLHYSGDSVLLTPQGSALKELRETEQVSTIELSYKHLLEIREKLPFLKDRHV